MLDDSRKNKDSIINTIDNEENGVYNVHMQTRYLKDIGKDVEGGEIVKKSGMSTNDIGHEIIYKLFTIIREESGHFTPIQSSIKDKSERTFNILYARFAKDIKEKKDLETTIKKKIENLKKNEFIVDYDTENSEMIKMSAEDLKDLFITLRKQRIEFYNAILEEYKKKIR